MTWPPTSSGAATSEDTCSRNSGDVGVAPATWLTITAWARDATSPTTPSPTRTWRPSRKSASRPYDARTVRLLRSAVTRKMVATSPPTTRPVRASSSSSRASRGRKERPGSVTDWMDRRATPASWSPRRMRRSATRLNSRMTRTMAALTADEQPRQGDAGGGAVLGGEEVVDDEGEQRPGDDQGGLAQEGVTAERLAQEAIGLRPVVLGDDGGRVRRRFVPVGGGAALPSRPAPPTRQASRAP